MSIETQQYIKSEIGMSMETQVDRRSIGLIRLLGESLIESNLKFMYELLANQSS